MYISGILPYSPQFKGTNRKEPTKVQSNEEKLQLLVGRACEVMAGRVENEVPENGKFAPLSVSWNLPGSLNRAMLAVEADALNPKDSRRLSVGVTRAGSDKVRQGYILKGTKKEILEFVKDPKNQEEIIKTARQLSDSTDEYYSELY